MLGGIVRLGLAGALLLLSSLVVLPATEMIFWYGAILVTEFGHWFSLASVGVMVWELNRRQPNFLTVALCLASAGFFLTPLVEAVRIGQRLPEQLAKTFGEANRPAFPRAPLSFFKLWAITRAPAEHEDSHTFTTKDGSALGLRVYSDGRAGAQPCLLIIHGGGWNSGDATQFEGWSRRLAKLGWRVASIDYRLAPQYKWPAQKEDLVAALAYLKAHAAELGIEPDRFVLLGRSAGGQIAEDVAYSVHDPAIRGCIASYAPSDMNFGYWTGKENDLIKSRPLIRGLMGGPPDNLAVLYHDASPLDFVDAQSPPTLLIHGGRDEIVWVRHSERLRDALAKAGRPVCLLELPWATHGFDVNPRGPGGQLEFYAMAWFLKAMAGDK